MICSNITLTENNKERINRLFVAFDTETTGLEPISADIIELAAIVFENGKRTKGFSTFINPGYHIPEEVTKVNNITDEMVSNAPNGSKALSSFISFLESLNTKEVILVAHNAPFDKKFLVAALEKFKVSSFLKLQFLDTLSIARKRVSGAANYKLGTLIEAFNIENKAAHRAAGDALACGFLLLAIKDLPEKETSYNYSSNNSATYVFTEDTLRKALKSEIKTKEPSKKEIEKKTNFLVKIIFIILFIAGIVCISNKSILVGFILSFIGIAGLFPQKKKSRKKR